ncbi:MAG: 30S ribosomal protein S9 [Candidatus Magasanikbacteria bacterium]|nr:30S ribosomal protein S9 [Candidatus Magasanikbacteria bacterium]MCA9389491.1 30S ribosomal protein S9 [Candidatus Magasanikbacteria bacterium]MCA9391445.1 30S ribosomal protein S9 [Candidatus Magasanikbacteria bacterium]USN52057.1 MAG: 30S ribosomal protein S9 [Candidatus Nomurabacteria bacterium]
MATTTETKKKTTTAAKPRAAAKKKEAPAKKAPVKTVVEKTVFKDGSYIYALGRRKTSVAKVYLIKNGKGLFTVNGRPMEEFFTTYEGREIVRGPLKASGQETAVDVSAQVIGGGINGQAESIRLGISRAMVELNPTYRTVFKKLGFMSRDPRAKERKKFGLKKARKSPQWSKR